MKSFELNKLPVKIKTGEITKKEALDKICLFINSNYPIFGLHKFDEDFREDVIVYFLERGIHVLDTFNENTADFFTFLYSNVMSYINTRRRTLAKKTVKDFIINTEGINRINEKQFEYSKINSRTFETSRIPYSYTPITVESLQKIFKPLSENNSDKRILVLAIKSSFYISDEMISKVCKLYNIKKEDFYNTIQYCKDSLIEKTQRHNLVLERRNYAYYHHKRCEHELALYRNATNSQIVNHQLTAKSTKHLKNWLLLNQKLENGFLYLRPTNKTIAEILGICERQVSYYLNCAKKDFEKMNQKKRK